MTKQEQAEQLRWRARSLRAQSQKTTIKGAKRVLSDRAEDLDAEADRLSGQTRRLLQ
jgi:hypothetical protein